MQSNTILAFDGHDGSGKTTLCKIIAEQLGGVYVRPFGGNNGINLIEAADNEDYLSVLKIGMDSIREAEKDYTDSILVFDRHWMTVLSLVPEPYWEKWKDFPPAILCWADLTTTKERLCTRDEAQFDDDYHSYYLNRYVALSNYKQSKLIDTGENNIQSCLKQIRIWMDTIKIIQQT